MNYQSDLNKVSLTEAAGLDTGPIPTDIYTSTEQYALERDRIFRRAWLKVGRIEQLRNAGDFFTKEIAILNASIIITRGKDGKIRALHNMCSHRGNRVVLQECGTASRFTCRYHSWTYQNTGELVGAPDASGFFDFDKEKCGLTAISCNVWDGWIFINFDSNPEVNLKTYLGSFGENMSGITYPFPNHCIILKGEIQANWKAVADAFSEVYHLTSIHPKTFAPVYSGKENPHSRLLSARIYGTHINNSCWLNTEYKPTSDAFIERWLYPATQTVTGTKRQGEVNPILEHPAVNPTKSENWAQDVNWIFPNTHIQISANRFWSHEFWPTSPTTTIWEGRFWQPEPQTIRERVQLERFTAQMCDGMLEDLSTIENTQRGMMSGAKSFLHLHDCELLIRHQIKQIIKWTKSATVSEAIS